MSKLQHDVNRSEAGKYENYIDVKSSAVLPRQLLVRRGDKQQLALFSRAYPTQSMDRGGEINTLLAWI